MDDCEAGARRAAAFLQSTGSCGRSAAYIFARTFPLPCTNLSALQNQVCSSFSLCNPQISGALLGEDQKLKLPRFLEEEEKDPEATKQARLIRVLA